MSTDVETRLRTTLRQRADDPVPFRSDVVGRFHRDERSHVAFRRVCRGGIAAVLITSAAALLMTVPLPDALPAVRVGPAAQDAWPVAQGPVRGSLADDPQFLDGLRRHVAASFDDGGWHVAKPSTMRVVYAGDVGRARVAFVLITVRRGPLETTGYAWYEGPAGADPRAMVQQEVGVGTEPPDLPTDVTLASVTAGGDAFVVLAPRNARFATSPALRFGADGRVHRDWTPAPSADGTLVVPAPAPGAPAVEAVKVTVGTQESVVLTGAGSTQDFDLAALEVRVRTALGSAHGLPGARPPSLWDARWAVETSLSQAHLPLGTTPFAIPWTGTVHGFPAFLVTVTPPGGGTLVYSFRRTDDAADHGTTAELRLLVPADGATTRPILWRLRKDQAPESDLVSEEVAVVLARGTARAELVTGGTVTVLAPDASGFSLVRVPKGAAAEVRAYAADGSLLGTTPLPPFATEQDSLPGETRETRLVD